MQTVLCKESKCSLVLKKISTGSEVGWMPLIKNALKYMDDDKFAETMQRVREVEVRYAKRKGISTK